MPGIRRRLAAIFIFTFFILVISVSAVDIKFAGYIHAWFSYGDQDKDGSSAYGFSMRRVRLKSYGSLSKSIQWGLQVGWDKQTASLIEVFINFDLSKPFKIKIGQFPVPGAISGTLTSTTQLDFVERAVITELWGENSALSRHRGVGLQVYGNLFNDKLYYAVMMANPRSSALYSPGIKSPGYSHEDNGLTLWGRVEATLMKGFKIGAFYSGGKTTDTDSNYKKDSYGAHLFYVKDPINFKIEYIAGEYGIEDAETKYNGMYALLGYKFEKLEPIIRYGLYIPNHGYPDTIGVETYRDMTLGMNYYHSNKIKFQVNYVFRNEKGIKLKNNLFYINLQYVF
jgi:phosphate-selective porin